jgi:hypothetical protein
MKIVPTSIEEQINRVDRQRTLYFGISAGLLAAWSVFRLIWVRYIGMTFGWFLGAMVLQLVLWGCHRYRRGGRSRCVPDALHQGILSPFHFRGKFRTC